MFTAYCDLHHAGWAHSVEVREGGKLVGGIYGLAIDRVFFGESMFSLASNASKAAMWVLCEVLLENDFRLLDCQVESPHLLRLGATPVARTAFSAELAAYCDRMG